MKYLSLLTWVTQLGFSLLFPVCSFLFLAYWLQNKFSLGPWVMVVCGIIGLLTSVSTAKSCIRAMLKAVAEITDEKGEPPVAFNNHS